ncbi:MarR family winged helix-turn-helix transcriptional regulator [Geotalea uraniireducens]|uniref:Transcriptional regulator, MarR family n=1 Tax=Geotalea uraniireducens (strain Rf4) TaxID=351605 RepID=A5G7B4_GEOUR|nr:MarR family transcriptional regulator [Geotalea uraniireducens]ABQ27682.1 transcriptional regulator, MarR family [Geotalea uraniireducens Rf4]
MFDIVDLPDSSTIAKLAQRYPMLEIPALETWLTLMRVSGDCQNDLDQFLARHNLSQRKFFVLILLMRNPYGLKVSQLAAGTGVSCPTMTGVVDGLLNAGLVTRETDEQDRRIFVVTITTVGQELLDQVLPQHYQRVSRIMSMLDEAERTQLNGLLAKIRAGLDTARTADAEGD